MVVLKIEKQKENDIRMGNKKKNYEKHMNQSVIHLRNSINFFGK